MSEFAVVSVDVVRFNQLLSQRIQYRTSGRPLKFDEHSIFTECNAKGKVGKLSFGSEEEKGI